jgi:hypothetical protein
MSVKGLAFRYAQAWANRNLDAIMALHTDDTIFHLHVEGAEGGGETVELAPRRFGMRSLQRWRGFLICVLSRRGSFLARITLSPNTSCQER